MKTLLFTLLGIIYYLGIHINIDNVHPENKQLSSFNIQSYIPQDITLHIRAKRNELKSVRCNNKTINFPLRSRLWFERVTKEVHFHVHKGDNYCEILTQEGKRLAPFIVKRKFTYINYFILFSLLGIVFITNIFGIFVWLIDKIKNKYTFENLQEMKEFKDKKISMVLMSIVLLGAILRVVYYYNFGVTHFQHDWAGHVEFIKYISNTWTLPLGEKGLQFPQQPLYYIITGGLYSLLTEFKIGSSQSLYYIGYFSLFCSFMFLYYGAKFFTLISNSKWVQVVAMSFIVFTPSLVYMSARINNDVLVMALSAFTLYHIVSAYQTSFEKSFTPALVGVSLLFMTKLSAVPMEILLFLLLLYSYVSMKDKNIRKKIKQKLYIFSLVGIFFLGLTLLKDYLPIENSFHMVNSSGNFPGQMIKPMDIDYFSTYNLPTLLRVGYSHVFGDDTIRYSFLTYQYGTMFFGEFKYISYFNNSNILKIIMQIILLVGTIFIMGFITYAIKLRRMSFLYKILYVTVILNLLLILRFVILYPVVCNTDFRYSVVSYILFAFIFAKGLEFIQFNKWIMYIRNVLLTVIVVNEILFFIFLFSS